MAISFVPGEPNKRLQAVAHAQWRGHSVMAYCSGNNLIILADDMKHLQTIYLDADATAVDINYYNGTIAVSLGAQVHIYEPMNEFMKVPRWQFSVSLVDSENHSSVNIVNWGAQDEIVVGSDYLTLWQVKKEFGIVQTSILWSLKQAQPVYLAKISQDSSLIASCSKYDKLLKVWNRSSFGEHSLFDLSYLLHSASITSIRWKRHDPSDLPKSDTFTNTLYTLSRDSILRIWSSYDYENSHLIQQWGSLDLFDDSCAKSSVKKFVNVIDDYLVTNALRAAISRHYKDSKIELQKKQPDLVIVADSAGNLVFYALENLSQNPPKMINIKTLKTIKYKPNTFVKNPEFVNFAQSLNDKNGDISLVIHDMNGVIRNVILDLSFLIKDNGDLPIGTLSHKLTGHNKSIQKIFRTNDGEAVLTTSRFEENAVWTPQYLKDSLTLSKKSIVKTPRTISSAILLEKGDRLLTICSNELILWDTSIKIARTLTSLKINESNDLLLFSQVPIQKHDHAKHYVIAIYKNNITKAWIISDFEITPVQVDHLPIDSSDIHIIASIDPVGAKPSRHRPVLSTITSDGTVQCWGGLVEDDKIHWVEKSHLVSNIKNSSYIRGSSIAKFAIVDESKKKLTIWDLNRNVLEFEQDYDHIIRDIDWTCTFNNQSILAVGFEDHSLLYTQLRYDYTNKNPPFLAIKKIDIKNYTSHEIGDSVWLKDGILIVGSGNQIFVSDKELDMENDKFTRKSIGTRNIVSNDILNLCSVLNGSLPLYHPQLLIQSLFVGKIEVVREILLRLFLKIRQAELSVDSIESIGSNLGFDINKFFDDHYIENEDFEEPFTRFDNNVAELLKEKLTNHSLPYLTRHQQITLLSTIEAVEDIGKNSLSLDQHGLRFYLSVKLYQLHRGGENKLIIRDINWALHSENKELLLQYIESSVKDRKITWSISKEYGLTHWITYDNLVTTFESIARNEFTSQEKRDPSACSIYYLALKKKQILLGLWRTSVGHPEQQKMLSFLKNDFREPRWKSASLKNAFVLLSKHRYMLAACFFLLADSLKDAVNVLIKQIGDLDLAIGVCRVYEGDNGPVLKEILTRQLLPIAMSNGDRWTTSYVFWKTRDQSKAIQSLVKAPIDVIPESLKSGVSLNEHSKSFIEDDPLLIVLYKTLREKSTQYLHGSLEISAIEEFQFISRVASIYTRMGCDYLSVYLVKNWKFIKSDGSNLKRENSYISLQTPNTASSGGSLLEKYGLSPSARRRESVLINYQQPEPINGNGLSILEKYGLASNSIKREDHLKEEERASNGHNNTTPPPQDAFKEPDMSSFAFGF